MTPAHDVQFLGASDDIQIMGPAEPATVQDYVTIMHGGLGTTPEELACAEKVKAPLVAAGACTLGMAGTGLFGVYKLFKGRPAAGVTALVGAGLIYLVGATLATAAAKTYLACTGPAAPTAPGGNRKL